MLRMNFFGGFSLWRGNSALTGSVTQRRRIAIFALLASGGERGVSRTRIQSLLWPDSEPSQARHVLNQLLYLQRRGLSETAVFVGGKTLRLNPEAVTSDVMEFDGALRRADPATAVGRYGGPFLDGFVMADASEFERWMEECRGRYARLFAESLRKLAGSAESGGDPLAASGWWQRAVDHDSLDSTAVEGLMRTLANAGNVVAALRAARDYQARLAAELGLRPSGEIAALTERLSIGRLR